MIYLNLADRLQTQVREGVFPTGCRLPGVRQLSEEHGVSVSTAVNACRELERRGVLEARPRSGFYVCLPQLVREAPRALKVSQRPRPVTGQDRVLRLLQAVGDPAVVNLGAAVPDPRYLPLAALERSFRHVLKTQRNRCGGYEFPPGAPELRAQVARRLTALECRVGQDDVLITNSCQEAVTIALRLLTQPGDVVAIESPVYYGLLQVLESLGLKALEIPTDPVQGISLEALTLALEAWPVKAVVLVPNFSNPLGACLSDARKQALLQLLSAHQIPLVEDDVYGDLPLQGRRPRPIKRWDVDGLVYYCGSFSKTVSPGLRVGWLVAPAFQARAEFCQYVNTVAVGSAAQLALAHYLQQGHLERFLRQVRTEYAQAVARMTALVSAVFPADTRVSRPSGGFVLWVELPQGSDVLTLMDRALAEGVSFAPGPLFSASGKFGNCLRLNCAVRWDSRVERALMTLARLLPS